MGWVLRVLPRPLIAGTALVLFGLLPAGALGQTQVPAAMADAVSLYAAGRHADALGLVEEELSALRSGADLDRLVDAIERAALRARAPAVGATLALEAAASPQASRELPRSLPTGWKLIEVGGRLVNRREVPDNLALAWHRAALALWQGPEVNRIPVGSFSLDSPGGRHGLPQLVERARERFPDDAGFLFARGLANEQVLHHHVYTRAVVRADPRRRVAVLIDGPGGKPLFSYIDATTRDLAPRAIHPGTAAFERLARGASDYRDRAVLHLGTLKVYLGRTDEAIDLWQSVSDSSPDADVRFLASLFLGRALWEQQRPREALELLLAAHQLKPQAQSALATLAAFLFLADDREQAGRIAAQVLALPHGGDDPWRRYLRGDHHLWPERLDALRGELHR